MCWRLFKENTFRGGWGDFVYLQSENKGMDVIKIYTDIKIK